MLSEQSKTVNDGGRSKPSVWECSEVIFRDAEKCRQADISHPKTSLHSEVETISSRWSQIGKLYRRVKFVEALGLPTSRRQNRGLKL